MGTACKDTIVIGLKVDWIRSELSHYQFYLKKKKEKKYIMNNYVPKWKFLFCKQTVQVVSGEAVD